MNPASYITVRVLLMAILVQIQFPINAVRKVTDVPSIGISDTHNRDQSGRPAFWLFLKLSHGYCGYWVVKQ